MTAPVRPKIRGERLQPTQSRSGESTNLSTKQAIRWRESWREFLDPQVAGYKVNVSPLAYTNRRRLRHYPPKNEGLHPELSQLSGLRMPHGLSSLLGLHLSETVLGNCSYRWFIPESARMPRKIRFSEDIRLPVFRRQYVMSQPQNPWNHVRIEICTPEAPSGLKRHDCQPVSVRYLRRSGC